LAVRAWCDHVVHVQLLSGDPELSDTCARFLADRFADREVEANAEPGVVELRSSPDRPVGAQDVATCLVEVGVQAGSIFDRLEWSTVEA
jgi:hypothetical protein